MIENRYSVPACERLCPEEVLQAVKGSRRVDYIQLHLGGSVSVTA